MAYRDVEEMPSFERRFFIHLLNEHFKKEEEARSGKKGGDSLLQMPGMENSSHGRTDLEKLNPIAAKRIENMVRGPKQQPSADQIETVRAIVRNRSNK